MFTINTIKFVCRSIVWGLAAGFLILFFMPESKMPFNWQSAQAVWNFYQTQQNAHHQHEQTPFTIENITFSSAVQKAYPSVVSINAFRPKGIREDSQTGGDEKILDVGVGFGSGIILEDGYLITNYHVIINAERISINLPDGRRRLVDLVGYDRRTDIAILKTDIQDLRAAQLANSNHVRTGDIVMAIGSPFGSNQSVSLGIVSAITHAPYARIQTDAAINDGNSGGPLINSKGEIIGINQTSINYKGGGQTGVNYAIPINQVKHIVSDIILHGRVRRNWLGLSAGELLGQDHKKYFPNIEQGKGIFVTGIEQNSPAYHSGIMINDLIISLDNQVISGLPSFYKIFYDMSIGKQVEFELIRNGKNIKINVQLKEEIDNT